MGRYQITLTDGEQVAQVIVSACDPASKRVLDLVATDAADGDGDTCWDVQSIDIL